MFTLFQYLNPIQKTLNKHLLHASYASHIKPDTSRYEHLKMYNPFYTDYNQYKNHNTAKN